MAFIPTEANPAVSASAAVATALASEGLPKSAETAQPMLGYWTSAQRSPDQIASKVRVDADHRLVWLVRISGLSMEGTGRGRAGVDGKPNVVNHEMNVMVDATTGSFVGAVSYR